MLKGIVKLLFVALIGVGFATVTASADAAKGQKIILKKLKKACHMNGNKLAHKHTQSQWKAIYSSGKFNAEIQSICPAAKPLKKSYTKHVYDFLYKYASDSGNVASC